MEAAPIAAFMAKYLSLPDGEAQLGGPQAPQVCRPLALAKIGHTYPRASDKRQASAYAALACATAIGGQNTLCIWTDARGGYSPVDGLRLGWDFHSLPPVRRWLLIECAHVSVATQLDSGRTIRVNGSNYRGSRSPRLESR